MTAQSGQCNETDGKDNLHSTLRHNKTEESEREREKEPGDGKKSTCINGSGEIGFTNNNTSKKYCPQSEENTPTPTQIGSS